MDVARGQILPPFMLTVYVRLQRLYETNFAFCFIPSFVANQNSALGRRSIQIST